jgi:methyl-accepting chemotaxis protein
MACVLAPAGLLVLGFLAALTALAVGIGAQLTRAGSAVAQESLARIASDFRVTSEAVQGELGRRLDASLRVAADVLARAGGLSLDGPTVPWHAVDQLTKTASEITLPGAAIGAAPLEANADAGRPTPVVDEVERLTGSATTLFQRMNERGDMLRVATTVRTPEGRRAIGTFIPAVGPDGAPSPVVAAVLRGDTYRGRAFVVSAWHETAYAPLRDSGGRVIGMLFVGVRHDAVEQIRHAVAAARVGQSGVLLVVGGKGAQRGKVLIGAGGHRDGDDLLGLADAESGRKFMAEIVDRAVKLGPAETASDTYLQAAPGAPERRRIAAFAYFAPWDWVLVSAMDLDEAAAPALAARRALRLTAALTAAVAALALALAAWAAARAARRIAEPVEEMARMAERIADGDLDADVAHASEDEVGRLADAFRRTVAYLREVASAGERLGRGDLSRALAPRSPADRLALAFAAAHSALERLVSQVRALTEAARAGQLSARADAASVSGAYAGVLTELNHTLDALAAPVHGAIPVLERLAARDLTARVEGEYHGEHARIGAAVNELAQALQGAVAQTRTAAEQVASASGQVASASQGVAQGASQQAAALEQAVARLASIADITRRTADGARRASALAVAAKSSAAEGHAAMVEVDGAIAALRTSAERTSKIIKDVGEISFQTHLLGLNAAVEAARAGSDGKGFAVVADEVRALARRAKEAAASTETLLEQSVRDTEAGAERARQATAKLGAIVGAIEAVSGVAAEIAASARDGSAAVDGVNDSVTQVGQVTQANAAGAEESSSAAQELLAQAEGLAAAVASFRVGAE